jgi:hypothetical protein
VPWLELDPTEVVVKDERTDELAEHRRQHAAHEEPPDVPFARFDQ